MSEKEIPYPYPEIRAIFNSLIECQNISPYAGWDIFKIRKIFNDEIKPFLEKMEGSIEDGPHRRDLCLIKALAESFRGNYINISSLNNATDHIRARLGLPSVDELNPDIVKMRNAIKKNGADIRDIFGGGLFEASQDNLEKYIVFLYSNLSSERKKTVLTKIKDIHDSVIFD